MAETIDKAEASAEAPDATTPPEGAVAEQQETTETPETPKTPEPEKATPGGAPDEYSFSAPEGQSFDSDVLSAFENVARELNLDNAQAQSVIDRVAPVIDQRLIAKVKEAHESQIQEWVTDAKKDQEIASGGFEANLAKAKDTMERIGTPELVGLLEELGLLNHKEVIRFGLRASQAVGEERSPVKGSAPTGEPQTWEERMYGGQAAD